MASNRHAGDGRDGGDSGVPAGDPPEPADRADPPRPDRLAIEEPRQVFGQLGGRGVAVGRALRQRLEHDRLQVAGHPAVDQARGHGLAAADLLDQLGGAAAVERRPQRQQLVERGPQAVDVGPAVDRAGPRLLGAHVARRAQQAVVMGQPGVGQPASQAEVGHPDGSLGVDQQVRRLDVAMDHP